MPKESWIEAETCRRLRDEGGVSTIKLGDGGWPDRLVLGSSHLNTDGRHVFVEFKQPRGRLTPAQQRRIPKLRKTGEVVLVIDDPYLWAEILNPRWWR